MTLSKGNKRKVKKVVRGLNKASKLHAGQAKTLKQCYALLERKVKWES